MPCYCSVVEVSEKLALSSRGAEFFARAGGALRAGEKFSSVQSLMGNAVPAV